MTSFNIKEGKNTLDTNVINFPINPNREYLGELSMAE